MTHDEPLDNRQEPLFVLLMSSDRSKQLGSFAPICCAWSSDKHKRHAVEAIARTMKSDEKMANSISHGNRTTRDQEAQKPGCGPGRQ